MNELERDKTFWQSTNDTLSRAYEELRIARDALAESQLQVAEQQAAIVRLVATEKERLEREMIEVSRRYGVKDAIAMVGVGNHGGGANSKDIADWRKTMSEMTATFTGPTRMPASRAAVSEAPIA